MKIYYSIMGLISAIVLIFAMVNRDTNVETLYLSHDGIERRTLIYIPKTKNEDKSPLILVFHGLLGNSEYTMNTYGFTELSEKEGFIVAYPEGTGQLDNALLSWNSGFCCGYAQENNVDDTGFIVKLLSLINNKYNVDAQRIFLVGFSNGGMISYKLISEHPELFAGAAIISSTPSGGNDEDSLIKIKPPKSTVPLIVFHGKLDTIIPYYGGYTGEENEAGIYFSSIPDSVEYWANAMGGNSGEEVIIDDMNVVFKRYFNEERKTVVEFYTLTNEGHTFPGRVKGIQNILQKKESTLDAREIIWEFFERVASE